MSDRAARRERLRESVRASRRNSARAEPKRARSLDKYLRSRLAEKVQIDS